MVFKVLIKFTDGTELIINGVSDFYVLADHDNLIAIEKNGYRQFINKDYIFYIGREFDLKNR